MRFTAGSLLTLILLPTLGAQHGFDPARLEALKQSLAQRGTKTLLIQRDGKTVLEWYAPDFQASKPHYSASLAKALVGGMSLALAIEDGHISPDDPASRWIPAWRNVPRKSAIRVGQLAAHTSGIEDAEQDGIPHMELPGWKGRFWRREPDPFTPSIHDAPATFEPGVRWAYSNPGMAALAYAVTASLRDATQKDIEALLRERLMRPLGVADAEWSIGYGRAYEVDGMRLFANWGGGGFSARAVAAIGNLLMNQGRHNGQQVMQSRAIAQILRDQGEPRDRRPNAPAQSLCFYNNSNGGWPGLPRDAIAGAGAGHQLLLVVPTLRLVVVRNGANLEPDMQGDRFWAAAYEHLFASVMNALADPPYPQSKVIRGVRFDTPDSIRRDADGSDNWPVTWGANDHLYTSYGDGWGFDPRVPQKLSQGWARIEGGPRDLRGVNIRTPTGERIGDGRAGAKASGLVMIGGTLYALIRNTGNAQLAWSSDNAKTWQWGFKFETSFATPSLLNFGKNYAGARDEYVYAYSQDGDSAYEEHDGVVLARAPKSRIREKAAWEYFAGFDASGKPRWTNDIAQRKPTLAFPGHCARTDAVYHPGLKRYLLALGYNHAGGWGLFEAPEPWGPWSVAYHTHLWDMPGSHGFRLPSKWIESPTRMTMIYSGTGREDAFCVRGLTLDLAP